MIGCKSVACKQGRKACPHPAKCWRKSEHGGGGLRSTPATSSKWILFAYTGAVFIAGAAFGIAAMAVL